MTAVSYRAILLAGLLPAATVVSLVAAPASTPASTPTPAAVPVPVAVTNGDPLETLVKDSPFLPQASAGGPAAGQNGPLELRGVSMERGSYVFSLFDLSSKESYWVGLNEAGYPFTARSYDRTSDTLTVEQQGRTLMLTLATARTMASNPAAMNQPAPGTPGAPTAPGLPGQSPGVGPNGQPQPVAGVSPTGITPDEAQRLQRIADEIRRRRAIGKAPVTTPAAPANTPTKP